MTNNFVSTTLVFASVIAASVSLFASNKKDDYKERMSKNGDAKYEKKEALIKLTETANKTNVTLAIKPEDFYKFHNFVVVNEQSELNNKVKFYRNVSRIGFVVSISTFMAIFVINYCNRR